MKTRTTLALFCGVMSVGMLLTNVSSASAAGLPVKLYTDPNFSGQVMNLGVGGSQSFSAPSSHQNQISSLKVPNNATVTLIGVDERRQKTFGPGKHSFVGHFINDRTDRIVVTERCAPGASVC